MRISKKAVYFSLGLLLTLSGGVGSFVMFLQPWRSCPEIDDSSAGCPPTSVDSALLGLAIVLFATGIVLLFLSNRAERIGSEMAGPFGNLS